MRERVNEDGSAELSEGTVLGKYRVVRPIGAGAMGAVYVGVHKDTGDRVAIKVLDRRLASLRQARERFLLEAQIAKRVRHPHIVDVLEAGDAGRNTYLVMELLTGEDLDSDRLPMETSRRGVFAVGDVRACSVKRVASAVGDGAQVVAAIHKYLAATADVRAEAAPEVATAAVE